MGDMACAFNCVRLSEFHATAGYSLDAVTSTDMDDAYFDMR